MVTYKQHLTIAVVGFTQTANGDYCGTVTIGDNVLLFVINPSGIIYLYDPEDNLKPVNHYGPFNESQYNTAAKLEKLLIKQK